MALITLLLAGNAFASTTRYDCFTCTTAESYAIYGVGRYYESFSSNLEFLASVAGIGPATDRIFMYDKNNNWVFSIDLNFVWRRIQFGFGRFNINIPYISQLD